MGLVSPSRWIPTQIVAPLMVCGLVLGCTERKPGVLGAVATPDTAAVDSVETSPEDTVGEVPEAPADASADPDVPSLEEKDIVCAQAVGPSDWTVTTLAQGAASNGVCAAGGRDLWFAALTEHGPQHGLLARFRRDSGVVETTAVTLCVGNVPS